MIYIILNVIAALRTEPELKNIEDAPIDNSSQKSVPVEVIEKEVGESYFSYT